MKGGRLGHPVLKLALLMVRRQFQLRVFIVVGAVRKWSNNLAILWRLIITLTRNLHHPDGHKSREFRTRNYARIANSTLGSSFIEELQTSSSRVFVCWHIGAYAIVAGKLC